MPFTFCHPAIILPLAKINSKRISITGLVIGSMSPDFEYFIKMRMEKIHGHSFAGLFYFDLPLTILLCFIFHLWVRDSLLEHLPASIRNKYANYIGMDWIKWAKSHWIVLLYSAMIGIFSHVFWDAFTHTDGYFVRHISSLQGSTVIFDIVIRKADLLQALNSIFGAIAILFAVLIPSGKGMNMKSIQLKLKYWLGVLLITLITLILRNGECLGDFIATFISGGLLGLIFTPFLLKIRVYP